MSGTEFRVPSSAVLREVSRSTCSVYDCEYVALAEDLNVHLITSDRKILREFPHRALSLREFAAS
jgi:predicted nucleic acid-binding protein